MTRLNVAPLYFILVELPMEAALHLDILALFWNIWCNPQTKALARIVFQIYNLLDPILLLETTPWPKESWKRHTMVAVTSHHEAALRLKSAINMKL